MRRRELRVGALAAAVLLLTFGGLAALTVSQRSDFEKLVVSSFSHELATAFVPEPAGADCEKLETYHLECLVQIGTRQRDYDLRFADTGCWRAITRGSGPGLKACVNLGVSSNAPMTDPPPLRKITTLR